MRCWISDSCLSSVLRDIEISSHIGLVEIRLSLCCLLFLGGQTPGNPCYGGITGKDGNMIGVIASLHGYAQSAVTIGCTFISVPSTVARSQTEVTLGFVLV